VVAVGALLQRHRVAAGLSQEALAERAGLSRRGISDLERGKRRVPHPATARRLADALKLDAPTRKMRLTPVRRPRQSGTGSASRGTDTPSRISDDLVNTAGVPLTGRAAECQRLMDTWRAAVSHGPRLVVIAGEAGWRTDPSATGYGMTCSRALLRDSTHRLGCLSLV
jgi:transcriptional regulator with XRE-family HTH domain